MIIRVNIGKVPHDPERDPSNSGISDFCQKNARVGNSPLKNRVGWETGNTLNFLFGLMMLVLVTILGCTAKLLSYQLTLNLCK